MFDDVMDLRDPEARAGPAWGPAASLESLLECLDALRERFKAAVAQLVGSSAAQALSRLVRRLLGCHEADRSRERYGGAYGRDDDYRRWADDEDDEDDLDAPCPPASRQPTLLGGIAAGLLALLSWLAPLVSLAGTLIG